MASVGGGSVSSASNGTVLVSPIRDQYGSRDLIFHMLISKFTSSMAASARKFPGIIVIPVGVYGNDVNSGA
jgi:hypothetical protein